MVFSWSKHVKECFLQVITGFVNLPPAVIVGIVSMAVLVVAAAWFLMFKRKKKGTGEDE